MAKVEVRLPSLLRPMADGHREVEVEASTVASALAGLLALYPALRVHLLDEAGAFRPHVLCFHNDTPRRGDLDARVSAGDRITILQAVSGGGFGRRFRAAVSEGGFGAGRTG